MWCRYMAPTWSTMPYHCSPFHIWCGHWAPPAWGLVAMAQGLGNYLNLVVEYGFGLSATRELARNQDSPEHIAELLSGVTAAKLTLVAAGTVLAILLQHAVPALKAQRPAILWSGVIAGMALGLNPMWYFQGRERMQVVASLEVGTQSSGGSRRIRMRSRSSRRVAGSGTSGRGLAGIHRSGLSDGVSRGPRAGCKCRLGLASPARGLDDVSIP